MAKDETASKRSAEAAHAYARYTINLQRAFGDLLPKLKRAYGQPARDAADERSQHAVAQLAVAQFLNQVGPDGLAHFADQFAKLAQALNDLDNGIRAPIFDLALVKRSDRTEIWLARALVAIAVEILRQCGHSRSRESAAEWVAQKYPHLEKLITERGADLERSHDLKTTIISWCGDFSSPKIRNKCWRLRQAEGMGVELQ